MLIETNKNRPDPFGVPVTIDIDGDAMTFYYLSPFYGDITRNQMASGGLSPNCFCP
jgi:hypothetical protein